MLEKMDLTLKLPKEEYRERMARLNPRLNLLQRKTADAKIPVVIVFEGWEASGKGTSISQLVEWLDPRHMKVFPIFAPTQEENFHPFLWRFWQKIPNYGEWAIFDRSWYRRVLIERMDGQVPKHVWRDSFNEINAFERQLANDGYTLIKFWLHIDKKEQRRRFDELEKDEYARWVITDEDRREHKLYSKYIKAIEEMFVRTSTFHAPWTIVEATHRRHAHAKISQTIADSLANCLKDRAPQIHEEYLATAKLIDENAEKKKSEEPAAKEEKTDKKDKKADKKSKKKDGKDTKNKKKKSKRGV